MSSGQLDDTLGQPPDENGTGLAAKAESVPPAGLDSLSLSDPQSLIPEHMFEHTGKLSGDVIENTGLEELSEADRKHLERLSKQVHRLMGTINKYRDVLGLKEREYLEKILSKLIEERNRRAKALESTQIKEAGEIIKNIFQVPIFGKFCIDGRVSITHEFGICGGINDQIWVSPQHVRAGEPKDFYRDDYGEISLDPDSATAKKIDKAFKTNDALIEIYDSHKSCAAREEMEGLNAAPGLDKGLYQDVISKKEIADAIAKYAKQKYGDKKKVINIQVTFNPENGFIYTGLETESALKAAKETGYTDVQLANLSEKHKIVSSSMIKAQFSKYFEQMKSKYFRKNFDWVNNYEDTALSFWKAMEEMKVTVVPIIKQQLTQKGGPYENMADCQELDLRALLLLANSFNGYGNTLSGYYPERGDHREQFCSVNNWGDSPPHNISAFRITPGPDVTVDAKTGLALINGNRNKGRIIDDEMTFEAQKDFEKAPVVFPIKSAIGGLTPEEWDNISNINWDFLERLADDKGAEQHWFELDMQEIMDRLFNAPENAGISLNREAEKKLRKGLDVLKECVMKFYEDKITEDLAFKGKIFIMPSIIDQSCRFRAIVPFTKNGRKHHEVAGNSKNGNGNGKSNGLSARSN